MLKNPRQIEEDLDSDNELPNDYIEETPDIPAYKNDRRFDVIHFPWVQKFLKKNIEKSTEAWKPYLYSTINERTILKKTNELKCGEKLLVTEGVLTQGDILCLKCIESSCSDSTLLWLVNFFIYKDLQSNFDFLKTCLVGRFGKLYDISLDTCSKVHNFEILIENEMKKENNI
ncbi:uncharacterized protein LOC106140087 [Amyelois transitella]|uniref:uncharacterized protein LOC106140087 n=1 Tax=Amyelois transitella TaxID=680683 RepID=UPI0029906289|nr:uncharacterized protein LOC106140087 [Amyelois transitella]XP_013197069.2 uncharacterized protein LOC106140087 [Amyelois transitella]